MCAQALGGLCGALTFPCPGGASTIVNSPGATTPEQSCSGWNEVDGPEVSAASGFQRCSDASDALSKFGTPCAAAAVAATS